MCCRILTWITIEWPTISEEMPWDQMDKIERNRDLERKRYADIVENRKNENTPFTKLLREKCEEAVEIILEAGVEKNQLLTSNKVGSRMFKRYSVELSIDLAGWSCSFGQIVSPERGRSNLGWGGTDGSILFLSEDFHLFTCDKYMAFEIDGRKTNEEIEMIDIRKGKAKLLYEKISHPRAGVYNSKIVSIPGAKITLMPSPIMDNDLSGRFYVADIDKSKKCDCRSTFPINFLKHDYELGPRLPDDYDEVNDELNRQLDAFFAGFVKSLIVINKE